MPFWGHKTIFWGDHPNFLVPSSLDTRKTTFSCWQRCTVGIWVGTRARFWHKLPKMAYFWVKNAVFGPKSIFWNHQPFFLVPSWLDPKKAPFLCCQRCTKGVWAGARAHFCLKNPHFFTLHPYNPHFLGSGGLNLMETFRPNILT